MAMFQVFHSHHSEFYWTVAALEKSDGYAWQIFCVLKKL